MQNLCGHPEGLLVDKLLKLFYMATTGFQLEEIVHILSGLDVPEDAKVTHGQLGRHFQSAELEKTDLILSQQLLSNLIWAEGLGFHVVLQVVPDQRKDNTNCILLKFENANSDIN